MPRVFDEPDAGDAPSAKTSQSAAEFTEQQRTWVRDIAARLNQQRRDTKLQPPPKRSST